MRTCAARVPTRLVRGVLFSTFVLWVTAIVVGLYGRTLHAPFVFDDVLMTKSRFTQATSLSHVGAVLVAPVPRKMTRASFALNFYADRLNPFGYHLVNVLIHAINGVLLFLLARALLDLLPDTHAWRRHTNVVAFLASTIWLVHPVQTQAVSYVWQRATCLCALFYLACVLTYVKARTASGLSRAVLLIAAAVTAVLALATKENAGSAARSAGAR